jgi:DNA-binding transcriptional MerR regulator
MFTIGILSKRTGVNIETIRYYERTGLIEAPPRTASKRRLFDDHAVRQLLFIRHARDLGFDVPTIRALLALQGMPEASCSDVTRIAADQLAAVESRIARLRVLKAELARIIKCCAGGRMADCRIIDALAKGVLKGARLRPLGVKPRFETKSH